MTNIIKPLSIIFLFLLSTSCIESKKSNIKKETNKVVSKFDRYLVGADLSHHQGKIDWKKSDKDLLSYVFIKSSEGRNFKDCQFKNNWNGLKKVGILRGAYHVYRPEQSGKSQFLNITEIVPVDKGSLPVAIDLEALNHVSDKDKKYIQKEIGIMIYLLKKHYGKDPILYLSNSSYDRFIKGKFNNKIWTWHYTKKSEPKKFGKKTWDIWQFATIGKNNVKYRRFTKDFELDLDYYDGTMEDFKKEMKVQ